mmetsp:Transcript_69372/g.201237  ORF Transcript_69372/g.201237 Transcript_69372/m.201237 type:complete len:447 (-) Transcript_69372:206-1546(-)
MPIPASPEASRRPDAWGAGRGPASPLLLPGAATAANAAAAAAVAAQSRESGEALDGEAEAGASTAPAAARDSDATGGDRKTGADPAALRTVLDGGPKGLPLPKDALARRGDRGDGSLDGAVGAMSAVISRQSTALSKPAMEVERMGPLKTSRGLRFAADVPTHGSAACSDLVFDIRISCNSCFLACRPRRNRSTCCSNGDLPHRPKGELLLEPWFFVRAALLGEAARVGVVCCAGRATTSTSDGEPRVTGLAWEPVLSAPTVASPRSMPPAPVDMDTGDDSQLPPCSEAKRFRGGTASERKACASATGIPSSVAQASVTSASAEGASNQLATSKLHQLSTFESSFLDKVPACHSRVTTANNNDLNSWRFASAVLATADGDPTAELGGVTRTPRRAEGVTAVTVGATDAVEAGGDEDVAHEPYIGVPPQGEALAAAASVIGGEADSR